MGRQNNNHEKSKNSSNSYTQNNNRSSSSSKPHNSNRNHNYKNNRDHFSSSRNYNRDRSHPRYKHNNWYEKKDRKDGYFDDGKKSYYSNYHRKHTDRNFDGEENNRHYYNFRFHNTQLNQRNQENNWSSFSAFDTSSYPSEQQSTFSSFSIFPTTSTSLCPSSTNYFAKSDQNIFSNDQPNDVNALNFNREINTQTQKEFPNKNSFYGNYFSFENDQRSFEINQENLIDDRNENFITKCTQEKADDTEKNDKSQPKISLVPLSFLLKNENFQSKQITEKNSNKKSVENQQQTTITTGITAATATVTATTAQSVKDPEKIKKRLLNRLVKMDKTDIKNVINDPKSKFDTVLKIHARKKLREEIRKQLKNMNVNAVGSNGEKTNENVFEPDESVDCGQIPEAILNEISKSLNIELLTEAGLHEDESYLAEIDATTLLSAEDLMTTTTLSTSSVPSEPLVQIVSQQENSKDDVTENTAVTQSSFPDSSPQFSSIPISSSPNMMTKIKNLESFKSTSDKVCKKSPNLEKTISKNELKNKEKSLKPNEIVTVNSSSSSSSDNSDNSSSDSESNSTSSNSSKNDSSSNNSYDNGKGKSSSIKNSKKKKILEGNVITHFNTLILPIMPSNEQQKFEKKSFRNNTDNLIFILDYCLKKTEDNDIVVSNYRKRLLKKNLKSKNNEEVLEFLIKKIKEIFEANKLKKKNPNTKVQNENSKFCEKTKDTSKQKVLKTKKDLNEKRSDSTSNTNSTLTNDRNCADLDSSAKAPSKGKYSQKSRFQKESSSNNEPITKISSSTVSNTCSNQNTNSSRSNTRKIIQMKNNPVKTSKSDNKLTQDSNLNLNKETFIDDHKEINNCKEMIPSTVQVKIALSAISTAATSTTTTTTGTAAATVNAVGINSCIENTDDKNQEESGEIIQLSSSDEGCGGRLEVGYNGKIATNTEMWFDKNKRDVVVTADGRNSICLETQFSKQNDNKTSDKDQNKILNEENNLKNNISRNETFSSIGCENDDENHLISETLEFNKIQRSWKSPGEKKCLQIPKDLTQNQNSLTENDNNNCRPRNENHNQDDYLTQCNANNSNSSTTCCNPTESLRLLSLIKQNKLSDAVLNNLKEIDVKLMELHKRKMYLEEMILKLQKDKMALDLNAMQLQQEKFIMINAALSNTNVSPCLNSNYQLQTNFNIKTESTPIRISVSSDDGDIGSANGCDNTIGGDWSNATDLMTNLLSASSQSIEQNSHGNFSITNSNQRKRKFIPDKKSSSKKIYKSPLNIPNVNNNIKLTQPSDNISKLKSQNEKRSMPEKQKIENKILVNNGTEVIISSSKIANSNGNSSLNSDGGNCSDSKEKQYLDTSESITNEKNSENNELSEEDTESCQKQQFEQIENDNTINNGLFENSKFPISHIKVINNFVIAASEDGNIYKFGLKTKKLIAKYSKHTETVTGICVYGHNFVYSISLDGYLKKTCLENFGLELQSTNLQEPLQCFDLQWNIAFIGSRWGNVFTYNTKINKLSETLLCSVGSSITALRATKEGARKILIVSSKGNEINFRDATSGLLLRTIQIPDNINIYSILLDGDLLYCGSNKNEIHTFNFTTGAKIDIFRCGNGAVSMKLYKKKLIFVGCYDGFVYVLDKTTGSQIGRFPGAGKMILALDIVGEKLITSSKNNVMEIRDIPRYISALLK